MTQLLAVLSIMALVLIVGAIAVIQSIKETAQTDTGDCANLPQNRWRRHPEKPSHLPFRQSRVERVSGYSRRTQRC